MQITIISVGRMKNGPEKQQIETYFKRCPWAVTIIEVEEKRPFKGAERMAREGELILKALPLKSGPKNAHIIALDERGKSLRSTGFAHLIQERQDIGVSNLIFLIGGADGYDQKVRARANTLLRLSDMTWPHMMVRLMLSEQLYRASCILSGHPYHKD
ncbi:MAG: 23S rRNA (pseudouridine(1915)-N(3))-methyltransferase RlmH [Emcibacter sp.]|nr:23S rRNA (pseudouridine(1915)-N(3))-methyltransferase RlmH [Emcibacter sp.]